MDKIDRLDQKWLKAAVLGCLWASSEIVLGSFLHNLRVPFSGNILTAIGLMLLISVSHIWKDKGLFWRSGLVCALMKAVSPSAVIFGPMIAILSEAVLLELSTRTLGRTWAGFIVGGILAMSWNLFHKIANLIIIYGFNIVDLYANFVKYAQNQFHIQGDITWKPILFLWIFYFVTGLLASVAGIYMGRRTIKAPAKIQAAGTGNGQAGQKNKKGQAFPWSVPWLFVNMAGVIVVLFLMNKSEWTLWLPTGIAFLAVWGFRYHRALRPLAKPKFWIFFVVITMLTSFLFVQLQQNPGGWISGLLTGLQMNFRAAIMIVGFSTIGTELYNPVIRDFFGKTAFRQLPLALEVAFDTLPQVIGTLPAVKDVFRSPVSIVHQLVAHADYFLEKVTIRFMAKPQIILITGKIGEGKTSLLIEVNEKLKNVGFAVGGIISPAALENGKRIGYNIVNVKTGEQAVLSRVTDEAGLKKVGRYSFYEQGLLFGKEALSPESCSLSGIVLVDEIGPWELNGQGWAESVNRLLKNNIPMIWVVRENIADRVIDEWNLIDYRIFPVSETSLDELAGSIIEKIS